MMRNASAALALNTGVAGRPSIESPVGVYSPASDSYFLIDEFLAAHPVGALEILDLCAGSGVVGVAAALCGHRVTAVDIDQRAVRHVRRNALLNGVTVSARQGDLFSAVPERRFEVILANPPYVPSPPGFDKPTGVWADGGADGRAVIDRICAGAAESLTPGGELWMVHSSVADTQATISALEATGLEASIVAERVEPYGPLMTERAEALVAAGLAADGSAVEHLHVIRATAAG